MRNTCLMLLIYVFISCNSNSSKKLINKKGLNEILDTLNTKHKTLTIDDTLRIKVDTLLKKSKPIFGYRFIVFGDFDGDKIQDTLIERYTDSLRVNEVAKYNENYQYEDLLFLSGWFNYQSFFEFKNKKVKKALEGGQLGVLYAENCGDLNGDGADDLLILPQLGDFSNCSTAHFFSLKNGKWLNIFDVGVWEWQFSQTPQASMSPALFGNYNFEYSNNDTVNYELNKALQKYQFIKRYKDNSIEFECRNFYDYDEIDKGFEKYGQQGYMSKYFKKVKFGHKWYFQDLKRPYLYLGNCTEEIVEKERIVICGIETPADMIKVRINLKHPDSPFKHLSK